MPDDPFGPHKPARFQPAAPKTQEELGGVLERAFVREWGKEPGEGEIRHMRALADESLQQEQAKLALAREAEAAVVQASERFGRSRNPGDQAAVEEWIRAAETYRRQAGEFRRKAEDLRQRIL